MINYLLMWNGLHDRVFLHVNLSVRTMTLSKRGSPFPLISWWYFHKYAGKRYGIAKIAQRFEKIDKPSEATDWPWKASGKSSRYSMRE